MKPRFALNLTPEAASLLRRMPDGWEELGSVPFDAPDFDAAVAALRAEARQLAGDDGFATKVVIPNSQILYRTLAAPGPDKASRREQIREGLEGLTPYEVKDLVYDFEPMGGEVRLAVVARDTLDEAEGFAEQHGFEPVAFVAIPEDDGFPREPSFGILSAALRRLPKGVKVERDAEPIRILPPPAAMDRDTLADEAEEQEILLPDEQTGEEAEPLPREAEEAAVPDDPTAAEPDLEDPASEEGEPELATAEMPDEEPAVSEAAIAQPAEPASSKATDATPKETVASDAADAQPEEQAAPEAADQQPEEPAADAEDAPKSDWAPPQEEWHPEPDLAALASLTPDETALPLPEPEIDEPAEALAAGARPPPFFAPEEPASTPPPLARETARPVPDARQLPPFAPASRPQPSVTSPEVPEAPYVALDDDDIPDMPPGTFASRRVAAEATKARPAARLTADPKPQRGAGRAADPLPRNPSGRSALPTRGATATPARGAASAAVAAPGIVGVKPAKRTEAGRNGPQAEPSRQTEAQFGGLGGRVAAQRGKPRFLGLILTVVLLVVLAAVAALSSYLVASRDGDTQTSLALSEGEAEVPAAGSDGSEAASDLPPLPDQPVVEDEIAADEPSLGDAPTEIPQPPEPAEASVAPASEAPQVASGEAGRAAPSDTPQDEIFLTTMDSPLPSLDAVALPPPPIELDDAPGLPLPPPPFGATYDLDERGLIRPSAEGVLAPGNFLLIEGKPPVLPPRRPEAAQPEQDAALTPATGSRPAANPGSIFPGAAPATVAGASAAADPALAGSRPRSRPADLVPVVAALPEEAPAATADPRMSGLRPRARPVDPEPSLPEAQGATLAMALSPAPRPDGAPEAVATSSGAISPLAIAVSRRPEARPSDFSDAIEAAVAAAVQAPRTPAAVAAIAAPRQVAPAVRAPAPEEEDEPEVAVAPRIPTKANVAQKATFSNAINLSKTNLIGVYGTSSNRYALVRQSNGRYVKVRVGDRIDGGVVASITGSELRYRKGSRMLALSMPKG
ncbi:translation initiation factor 2 [Rhodobacter sp. NSM]|uniref:translation initiation factor 2 n=1 Tax=Rhodobacter sp. NSM TaxID=3457501 RepID=UPI003FD0D489